jgi:hypothetical protein
MNEVSIAAQRAWIIISTCIIVVMAVGAVAVLVWWFVTNFSGYEKKIRREDAVRQAPYAAAADIGWTRYYEIKDLYQQSVKEYESKINRLEKWDRKRIKRIKDLEKQLRDNGIEPISMDKGEVA